MTIDEAIQALGGTTATAKLFGVTPAAVSNWKAFGRFPDRLHYRISRALEARGLAVNPELFGEPPPLQAAPLGDGTGAETQDQDNAA